MQQILREHSVELSQQLSDAAHSVLDRVVNEEQYHVMTNRLSAAITRKSEENLTRLNNEANRKMNDNDDQFRDALAQMRNKVSAQLQQVTESNRRLDTQDDKIKQLQGEISSLRWIVGICSGSAVVVAAIGLFRYLQ